MYPDVVLLIVPVLPPFATVVASTFALHPLPQGPIRPPFHLHEPAVESAGAVAGAVIATDVVREVDPPPVVVQVSVYVVAEVILFAPQPPAEAGLNPCDRLPFQFPVIPHVAVVPEAGVTYQSRVGAAPDATDADIG